MVTLASHPLSKQPSSPFPSPPVDTRNLSVNNPHQLMRFLDGHLGRPFLGSAMLAMLALCGGCQTASKSLFTASGPAWHVQQGQALWCPGQGYPEIAGDVIMATDDQGRCLVQFAKTPLTIVSVQVTGSHWLIQFPPENLGFSGARTLPTDVQPAPFRAPRDFVPENLALRPPTRFLWVYLPDALSGRPLPASLHFSRESDGGWRFENSRSGESVKGFLAP